MAVDMEIVVQVVNRLGAMLEQYDMLEQSLAQIEMQNEVVGRVPDSSRESDAMRNQIFQSKKTAELHRDASLRTVKDITGLNPAGLREVMAEARIGLQRYVELDTELLKIKQAFEILVESNGFDEEEGSGGSRKDFEIELTNLRKQRDVLSGYVTRLLNKAINKQALVGASDSLLHTYQRTGLIGD